jgi:hypothetical protein
MCEMVVSSLWVGHEGDEDGCMAEVMPLSSSVSGS